MSEFIGKDLWGFVELHRVLVHGELENDQVVRSNLEIGAELSNGGSRFAFGSNEEEWGDEGRAVL